MKNRNLHILVFTMLMLPALLQGTQLSLNAYGQEELDIFCQNSENPFKDVKPFPPTGRADLANDLEKPITASDASSLKFELCNKARSGGKACDVTFGKIQQYYRDAETALKKTLKSACDKSKTIASDCSKQSDSFSCIQKLTRDAQNDLSPISSKLKDWAQKLENENRIQFGNAKKSANSFENPNGTDVIKYLQEAQSDDPKQSDPNQLQSCRSEIRNAGSPFCDFVMAAKDANFFSKKMREQSQITGSLSNTFGKYADTAKQRGENTTSAPNEKTDEKGLLGGIGLEDMMKLATLGIAGATAYCSATGKCSQKNNNQSSISDPASANTAGATSPTPNSTDSASNPKSSMADSSLKQTPSIGLGGVNGNEKTGVASKLGSDTSLSPSSGFSPSKDFGLSSFNGSLPRTTASGGGSNGGGAGGGMGGGGGSLGGSAAGDAANGQDHSKSGENGSPSFGGGGGMGASGGFNLGDSHGLSTTDAALKSVLNGDGLPVGSNTDLAGLDGLGADAGKQSLAEAGENDPENLFVRVRNSYVRSIKRGSLSQGLGENL